MKRTIAAKWRPTVLSQRGVFFFDVFEDLPFSLTITHNKREWKNRSHSNSPFSILHFLFAVKPRVQRLLTVYLVAYAELLPSFRTTSSQNAATIGRLHALAEAMLIATLAVVRLKCAFHLGIVFLFVSESGCKVNALICLHTLKAIIFYLLLNEYQPPHTTFAAQNTKNNSSKQTILYD